MAAEISPRVDNALSALPFLNKIRKQDQALDQAQTANDLSKLTIRDGAISALLDTLQSSGNFEKEVIEAWQTMASERHQKLDVVRSRILDPQDAK
jgi:hypothetical protein